MMVDIAHGVFQVAQLIYERVQLVKANKSQCERLVERIRVIESAISDLDEIPKSDHFKQGLNLLDKCLKDCLKFINQFMEGQKWYRQAIKAKRNESQFGELNRRLKECLPLLNLGMVAQQITNREQDIADQKADAQALKVGQAEILSLNQRMLRELQEFKNATAQRDKILARQLVKLFHQSLNVDGIGTNSDLRKNEYLIMNFVAFIHHCHQQHAKKWVPYLVEPVLLRIVHYYHDGSCKGRSYVVLQSL